VRLCVRKPISVRPPIGRDYPNPMRGSPYAAPSFTFASKPMSERPQERELHGGRAGSWSSGPKPLRAAFRGKNSAGVATSASASGREDALSLSAGSRRQTWPNQSRQNLKPCRRHLGVPHHTSQLPRFVLNFIFGELLARFAININRVPLAMMPRR
jgi:hypothetical protein